MHLQDPKNAEKFRRYAVETKLDLETIKTMSSLLNREERSDIRIYFDGAFDLPHSGHYNAVRQAKAIGDTLVCGVCSDEEVTAAKGPCVLTEAERTEIMSQCKWVDEVYCGAPYDQTIETLDKYNCDYAAHGDDLCLNADGEDACLPIKKLGRFKVLKRTEGVSTTNIIGKILASAQVHKSSLNGETNPEEEAKLHKDKLSLAGQPAFLLTSRRF
jgi:ethanolamine-phosphate cytidylyltransferase